MKTLPLLSVFLVCLALAKPEPSALGGPMLVFSPIVPGKVVSSQIGASDLILHGRVMEVTAEQGENGYGDQWVQSQVVLEVLEPLKGSVKSPHVFKSLGGVIRDQVTTYSHTPSFKPREEVVVFLKFIDGVSVIPLGWEHTKLNVLSGGQLHPLGVDIPTLKQQIAQEAQSEGP